MAQRSAPAMSEEKFKGAGGLNIFVRSWQPDETARGVVAIVPGFNSHSGRYRWVAEEFAARGLAVYAVDLRGRGKSDGARFYVEKIEEYLEDVDLLASVVKAREPGLPVFLLGHSAGGVIASLYALENQAELAGLICESFALQVPAPDVALSVIKGLGHVVPHAPVLRLKNEDFSRDPDVVRSMNEDPLLAHEVQPAETVAALIRGTERLDREFPSITLPLLVLHGTLDRATRASGSQLFYEAAGSSDKRLKLYKGHYHDLLADLDKEVVMADIQEWIDLHLAATVSPEPRPRLFEESAGMEP